MLPLKIGACLEASDIAHHREWLFGDGRDIELQDFLSHKALTTEFEDRIGMVNDALSG